MSICRRPGEGVNRHDYDVLHGLVFRDGYPGYKPTVKEIPNGDGKVDAEKRFAHIAEKYLTFREDRFVLLPYLKEAHAEAIRVARAIGIPEAFMPDITRSALRVLEYPPGAVSNLHRDFDLFTLMMYRDQPRCFVAHEVDDDINPEAIYALQEKSPLAHFGELAREIGFADPTPHEVTASSVTQHSIVYFAIPRWEAFLPSGETVGQWLAERYARSRVYE